MEVVKNMSIALKTNVDGEPNESDFELKTEEITLSVEPGSKDVIVKVLYASIDPYQLNRMKTRHFTHKLAPLISAITPGKAIDSHGVGKVIASGNHDFVKGDLVTGLLVWGEYATIKNGEGINKLDSMGLPLSYHAGAFGIITGLTAYAGFFEVCKPKKGEKVFVSAASGSVGSMVGQYAKHLGCYVVGCAGSKKKVELLKEKLGFDDAFNYKEESDLKSALGRYFPDGIDIYFDNVGGELLEAAVANMSIYGRVAICGAISEYAKTGKRAAPDMQDVLYNRVTIQGFVGPDYMNLYSDFLNTTADLIRTGKMHVLEDVSHGVQSIPSAFVGLFRGDNVGKKIVQISED